MQRFPRSIRLQVVLIAAATLIAGFAVAEDRPKSPEGSAATQIGDAWIDVSYSRPILRGRGAIFGSGEEYGKQVTGQGAPLWRVGANVTTRIRTGLDLVINDTPVPAGEYSLFIELKEGAWTAILSKQPYMEAWDRAKVDQGITWGAYGYNPEHDVVRAPMAVSDPGMYVDQMTIFFADVSDAGGTMGVAWANQMGMLPFKVAQ
jgi:hypothetical protein